MENKQYNDDIDLTSMLKLEDDYSTKEWWAKLKPAIHKKKADEKYKKIKDNKK